MRSFLGWLLRGLDGLRRVLHLLLLLAIFGFVVGVLRTSIPRLPDKAALVIHPEGEIVEQRAGDPLQRAVAEVRGIGNDETLLRDLIDVIEAAKGDERIQALVLDFDTMSGAGQPTLDEFARAVTDFRQSGKKVIARSTGFTRDTYYVAAHADEIYVDPLGFVLLEGYDRYRMYFKEAFDKLGVDVNVFRVGTYKSAVEPYVRQNMSKEDREESVTYLGSLWDTYLAAVAAARGLEPEALRERIASFADDVEAAAGDASQVALDSKLVTGVKSSLDVEQRLTELVGEDKDTGSYRSVGFGDYLRVVHAEQKLRKQADERIGVIVASGEILDGFQPAGMIGGNSMAELIRDARLDDDLRALVLRIDSPGGSVLASEQIYQELLAFRATGRPVVVSMGDLAASGGYYIAAPADEIWASPATITGSIGIFAAFPTVNRALDKLGIDVDGVGTTPLSGEFRLDRPVGPAAARLLQATIDRGYEEFLARVSSGRTKSRDEVDAIAQGRVWSGIDAQRLGLVDQLGTFRQAVQSAARRAELDEGKYAVEYLEPKLSLAQQLALNVKADLVRRFGAALLPSGDAALLQTVRRLEPLERELLRWSRMVAPNHLYAYCFCSAR
ncbi:MAG: signal peptide peptidase SppA [Sinobacteraceae bacterium]|nr:signal peptide peptidase SppA [Nevskiaceae bacterium]MCP5359814.1 signal peptide peptidase SppA [Nevskiaceae bacterium]